MISQRPWLSWLPLALVGVALVAATPLLLQCSTSRGEAESACEDLIQATNALCEEYFGLALTAESCDLECVECDNDDFSTLAEVIECQTGVFQVAASCIDALSGMQECNAIAQGMHCRTRTKDAGGQTAHSSNTVPPKAPDRPETDVEKHRSSTATVTGPPAVLFASFDVCAGAAFPTGDVMVFEMHLAGDVPEADPTWLYQYGFVLDVDGNGANNYQASAQFPNDFFDSTDRWYVANYDPAGGWGMAVTDAQGGGTQPIASDACVSIRDNIMILTVPRSELGPGLPLYRVTAFAHQGDFGLNDPFVWSGDVEPPVGEPLLLPPF